MSPFIRYLGEETEKFTPAVPPKCLIKEDDDHHRLLAASGPESLDFTVFSVAVMTLVLVLAIELLRHAVVKKATRHRFAKRVLDVLFEELSTLGIVEAIIFLLLKFSENDNFIEKEIVIAQVHFMLFYTTIINAILTCWIYYGSKKMSTNLWVKSEAMEMDHYVTIRRQFNVLDKKFTTIDDDNFREETLSFNFTRWKAYFSNMLQYIKSPIEARNRNAMLVVIRFHEIRAHFLKENNLPMTFKVSGYLMKCERDVFQQLVHIPTSAWVVLIGLLNLIYYFMGIVAASGNEFEQEKNNLMIGKVLSCLFVAMCISFMILSSIILRRVKWIFSKIMSKNFTDKISVSGFGKHATQLELFFLGHPDFVITSLQFMQFGYALSLGTFLIFWKNIGVDKSHAQNDKHEGFDHFAIQWQLALFICLIITYLVFHQNVKNIIPRFTLCTNLGQLVNKKQLNETLSMYHLNQEKWKRKIGHSSDGSIDKLSSVKHKQKKNKSEVVSPKDTLKEEKKDDSTNLSQLEQISKFVYLPTDSLPDPSVLEKEQEDRPKRRDRKERKRSLSDSAAFFSAFPASTQSFRNSVLSKDTSDLDVKKSVPRITQSKTVEDIVPQKPARRRRERAVSAPMKGGKATLFAITEEALKKESDKKKENKEIARPLRRGRRGSFRNSYSNLTTLFEHKSLSDDPVKHENGENQIVTDEKDSATVTTSVSMYAGSDTEDVPDALIVASFTEEQTTIKISWNDRLCHLYQKKTYNMFDTVIGTCFCLYLVAMRIEILLVDSCKIFISTNSLEFSISVTFWLEFALLTYFTISSTLFVVAHYKSFTSTHRFQVIAAESCDIILSCVCILLLLLSEFFRCTSHDCATFGKRTEVGYIEPFTAIVVFRPLRHIVGHRLGKLWEKRMNENDDRLYSLRSSWFLRTEDADNPIFVHDKKEHGHHDVESTLTIVNEWKKAVERHPDVVKIYGMFSAELLQVMLGLEVDVKDKLDATDISEGNKRHVPSKNIPSVISDKDSKKWNRLSVSAQAVITSGIAGQPVNSKNTLRKSTSFVSNYGSDEDEMSLISSLDVFDNEFRQRGSDYEISGYLDDEEPDKGDDISMLRYSISSYDLKAPNSRLIRSMRRCERKVLPFSDSWELVDVAITQHEILFFAIDDDIHTSRATEEKKNAVQEAMTANHGGKGLLLSDIAAGRRIVGHTDVTRITSIKIQLHSPVEHLTEASSPENKASSTLTCNEYWNKSANPSEINDVYFQEHFDRMRTGHLKIQDEYDHIILLRFLCDLDMKEKTQSQNFSKKVIKDDLKTMMSLLWCHTLVRQLGTDQLNQKLPHFGNDNDDELNDYVEEIGRDNYLLPGRVRTLRQTIVTKSILFRKPQPKESKTEVDPEVL